MLFDLDDLIATKDATEFGSKNLIYSLKLQLEKGNILPLKPTVLE